MQIDFTTREGRRVQGRLIQRAAEEAGVSLEALARAIGCSRALIYQYVSGATLAQADRIQQIAEHTGKPLLYFYGSEMAPASAQEQLLALRKLLDAQISPPDLPGATATCEQLIVLARQASELEVEGAARLRQVMILLQQGEAARALTALEQAIPIFQQQQMTTQLRAAEQNRGHALLLLGQTDEAEAVFQSLVTDSDWATRWQGLVSLAAVVEQRGRYGTALDYLDKAQALAATAPNTRAGQLLRLYVAGNLANINLACGDYATALADAQRAQALALELANQDQYTESLMTSGVCLRMAGELLQSRAQLETATRWARLSGDTGREAMAQAELAQTLVELGYFEEARARGKDALQGAIASSTRRAELSAQLALAVAYLRTGLPLEARYHAVHARETSLLIASPYAETVALVVLGEAHLARKEADEARQAFSQARELAENIGARVPAIQAGLGLTRLGETVDSAALLAQAREVAVPLLLWPALLQHGAQQEAAGEILAAEASYREAVEVLDALRRPLANEPEGDCLLEWRDAWNPYLSLARVSRTRGNAAQAEDVIARAEWPPLAALAESIP